MATRNGGVQSVERALDVLEELGTADGEMGISELGQATSLPYATIHRLVSTLVARGYVRQDPRSRKYVLGARLVTLGTSAGMMLGGSTRPFLEKLVDLTGETANLALLEDGYVVYVAQAESPHLMRMFTTVGNRVPPHRTAVGKVLLAELPRPDAERIIERTGLPAKTKNTITDPDVLFAKIDEAGDKGYALDLEESEEGVTCVAVPLLPQGGLIAALSISGPTTRLNPERRPQIVQDLQKVAEELSDWIDGSANLKPNENGRG